MIKRLERFGKVRIVDETNGFGLEFVNKAESRIIRVYGSIVVMSSVLGCPWHVIPAVNGYLT